MEKKDKIITLLAVQYGACIGDIKKNINNVKTLLEDSLSKNSSDFVFLPEVWTCGWDCDSFNKSAEKISNSSVLNLLSDIARKYSVNIIGGSLILEHNDGNLYNTIPVFNRKGNLVCTYEKNHLFSYYGDNEGEIITKGKSPVMVELDGIKIGLSICYDIRFPELYRAYRKAGADILINLAAWGAEKKVPWDVMTKARAVENQTYFVALTQSGYLKNGKKNLGHSMIIDYKGDIVSEINFDDNILCANIDLKNMYEFREKCKILDDIRNSYEVDIR